MTKVLLTVLALTGLAAAPAMANGFSAEDKQALRGLQELKWNQECQYSGDFHGCMAGKRAYQQQFSEMFGSDVGILFGG